jgi:hypothetical protein
MAVMDTDAMDVDEYDIAIEDVEVEALPHMQETGLQVDTYSWPLFGSN